MPWTLGLIDRFLDAHVRTHAITKPVAEEIRSRAHFHFKGKKPETAISGRWGRIIFEGHDSLFEELVQGFGSLTTEADLIAFGQKAAEQQKRRRCHHA